MKMPLDDINALAAAGELIAYFGYGSLVNPATHRTPVLGYVPAKLRGWRRAWVARSDWDPTLPIALLSASPSQSDEMLDGLLVFDRRSSLPSLDKREAGYQRHQISLADLHIDTDLSIDTPLYIYEAVEVSGEPSTGFILQSYLDAVLQGFDTMHGEGAVTRFLSTTDNFHTPILMDRQEPQYPRAVSLDDRQQIHIDQTLAHLNWVEPATVHKR
ncbi:MAG: gamma-glutamylcyclotransferase family protein [Pseudomonadota bacterium]